MPGSSQSNIFSAANNNGGNNAGSSSASNANGGGNGGGQQQQAVQVNYAQAYNYIHPSMIQQAQAGPGANPQHQQMQGPPIPHQAYSYPSNQFGKLFFFNISFFLLG